MGHPVENVMTIEAELRAPVATAQLVRFHLPEQVDNITREDDVYRFDMCLTPRPRNARGCYPNRWSSQRFERLGNVFVLPPGEDLLARSDGCCQQASLICLLYPEPMRAWFDGDFQWTERRLSASLDIRDANIRSLLLRLVQEARNPGFASEMLVELIAAQMTIEFARYCRAVDEGPATGGLAPWRLQLIDDRLRAVSDVPTLAELAGLCRLSVRQLTRGFRASRGCSIGDYVANARVEHAKELLATAQSVKSIAYSLGFSSPSSFCFAFRRATGETPRQFRHRLLRAH